MKVYKFIFWITTGSFSAFALFTAYNYLAAPEMKGAFEYLGFPDYFRIELAIAKISGAIALLVPLVPKPIKIFAYVGFTINLISAVVAHLSKGEPVSSAIFPLLCLLFVLLSYYSYTQLHAARRLEVL